MTNRYNYLSKLHPPSSFAFSTALQRGIQTKETTAFFHVFEFHFLTACVISVVLLLLISSPTSHFLLLLDIVWPEPTRRSGLCVVPPLSVPVDALAFQELFTERRERTHTLLLACYGGGRGVLKYKIPIPFHSSTPSEHNEGTEEATASTT
jgi:hypothetical protein